MASSEERLSFFSRRIIAIRGAKGGVGSSMAVSNLGIFLAQIGKRVLLIDANINNGGLYSWLGTIQPKYNIGDLLYGRVETVEEVACETRITGLYLLAGSMEAVENTHNPEKRFELLWKKIEAVEADFIIIDLPGTVDNFTLNLFCMADYSILVTMPLPDSVEATYRFMVNAWIHRLRSMIDPENREAMDLTQGPILSSGLVVSPRKIISRLSETNNPACENAVKLSRTFHPQIIVNQVRIKEDEELGEAMVSAATRWLGFVPLLLGSVGWDDNVWLSQRRSRPLLIDFGGSRACKDLEHIVRNVMNLENKDLVSPFSIPPKTENQNYYEMLEIYPGASEEEVRRAYRQIRSWFGIDGIACRGVCSNEQRERFQSLAETAHAKLVDKSQRRQYDRKNFPNGFSSPAERNMKHRGSIAGTVAVTQESLPVVELTEDHFVDGAFLGKIRRNRNVDLVDISNRAKISVRYLQAIEEERFEDLPAAVFTRGFVTEFARFLKIDPRRATRDFMAKYSSFFESSGK